MTWNHTTCSKCGQTYHARTIYAIDGWRDGHASAHAMAEPEPDPYAELIDELADVASDAFPINHSASDKDDWRNVVKAVIDGLREGAEDKLAIALWGATPTREDNWVVMRRCVDAILPKEPKA